MKGDTWVLCGRIPPGVPCAVGLAHPAVAPCGDGVLHQRRQWGCRCTGQAVVLLRKDLPERSCSSPQRRPRGGGLAGLGRGLVAPRSVCSRCSSSSVRGRWGERKEELVAGNLPETQRGCGLPVRATTEHGRNGLQGRLCAQGTQLAVRAQCPLPGAARGVTRGTGPGVSLLLCPQVPGAQPVHLPCHSHLQCRRLPLRAGQLQYGHFHGPWHIPAR